MRKLFGALALAAALAFGCGAAEAAYYGPVPFPVSAGGTGSTTLAQHGILLGEGTSALGATAVGTNGQVLLGQSGADPAWETMSGDATIGASGTFTLATVNASPGTYTCATVTVNGKGLVTGATTNSCSGAEPSTATVSSTPVTLTSTNLVTTIVNTTTASVENLPSAVTVGNGWRGCVKDGTAGFASNNAVLKSPTSGQIDGTAGSTGVTLNQTHEEICVISDGANFWVE